MIGGCGKTEWESFCKRYHNLETAHRRLLRAHDQVQCELAQQTRYVKRNNDKMRQNQQRLDVLTIQQTPRGDLRKSIAGALQVDPSEFRQIAGSTQDGVQLLIERLQAAERELQLLRDLTPNDDPYFLSEGSGENVPKYLRTKRRGMRIRNRRFAKRDVGVNYY